ncbi:hypothetical protein M0R45_031050 [Rubus argutus]|uniref:Uncharacterized protein n=1 Tax=Rubus argutus TaxID=59490 RepID=A0AAW1WH60_RUBAR
MQENKPWTFQVDTYGLCVIVHMMLHNSYMEIDKKPSPDGGCVYLPMSSLKSFTPLGILTILTSIMLIQMTSDTGKVELWKNLFVKLLNSNPGYNEKKLLQDLRESFQEYMCSDPHLIKTLSDLLAKQRLSMCVA